MRPLAGLRGFLGLTDHLVPASDLRSLLESHLTYSNLEDTAIPLSVVTTEITTGAEVLIARTREATNRGLMRGTRPDDGTELLSLHRHLPEGTVVPAREATGPGSHPTPGRRGR